MTLRGYWALTLSILCGLGSISFASKFLLLFAVFIFALLIVSFANMYFLKSRVRIDRKITPEKNYEDSEVLVTLEIKGAATDTVIKDYFDDGKRSAKFFFDKGSKEAISHAQYKFRVNNRGIYKIGPVLVEESDWLGFFSKNRIQENDENLFVYPKMELIASPKTPLQAIDQSSYFDSKSSSLSEDLFGLKEYSAGDDIRLIHWKTSSRAQKLFVRHHEPIATRSNAIVLDVDTFSYDEGEFEPAIRLAASLCQAALAANENTIFAINDRLDPIATHEDFFNEMCGQQLTSNVVPLSQLTASLKQNERDIFVITGSKAACNEYTNTFFKVTAHNRMEKNAKNIYVLNAQSMFKDYETQVGSWNAQEASASL